MVSTVTRERVLEIESTSRYALETHEIAWSGHVNGLEQATTPSFDVLDRIRVFGVLEHFKSVFKDDSRIANRLHLLDCLLNLWSVGTGAELLVECLAEDEFEKRVLFNACQW